eukprot:CAMPEP_0172684658 /NCGR_PEP_ID=MMETSP1074-20121228/19717_1 /TAXON_ID=2916 /ORGANISM="Ceratium fusus, Strain PA161109" /LENGTH=176 /DNA_ID=CAMNT_0013503707 /DNA_START=315 /DNA_END=841 /DNA_ORIENTATION=+
MPILVKPNKDCPWIPSKADAADLSAKVALAYFASVVNIQLPECLVDRAEACRHEPQKASLWRCAQLSVTLWRAPYTRLTINVCLHNVCPELITYRPLGYLIEVMPRACWQFLIHLCLNEDAVIPLGPLKGTPFTLIHPARLQCGATPGTIAPAATTPSRCFNMFATWRASRCARWR